MATRPPVETRTQDGNDSRKATNAFQYFNDNKLTGDINKSIEMTIRGHNVCAGQHRFTEKQKSVFFVNVLVDPARTFFFNDAQDDMSFDEIARIMIREYNSDARQLSLQGMLETLRLEKYISEHNISNHSVGLTKVFELIDRLMPQCQPQFRSDPNKINYLRNAVIGLNWVVIPIGDIISAKYSYTSFVASLREHVQLENDVILAHPSAASNIQVTVDSIYHQQYGRHPKNLRKHVFQKPSPPHDVRKKFFRLLRIVTTKESAICVDKSGALDKNFSQEPSAITFVTASRTVMLLCTSFQTLS